MVIPVAAITIYVILCYQKEKRLLVLFKAISRLIALKPLSDQYADQAIQILHQNKVLIPLSSIVINIQKNNNDLLAYYLLRAEIRFLLTCLEQRRDQKLYLNEVTPNERSLTLKALNHARNLLENVEIAYLDFPNKLVFVINCYRMLVKIYYYHPDENSHSELNFQPLFKIVDKTAARELLIFPYYPGDFD